MNKMGKVSDVDQAGNVLYTYAESEKEGLKIVHLSVLPSHRVASHLLQSANASESDVRCLD